MSETPNLHFDAWVSAASLPDTVEEEAPGSPSWIAMQEACAERDAEEARIDVLDRQRKTKMVLELNLRQVQHKKDKAHKLAAQEQARLHAATPRVTVELAQTVFLDVVGEKQECSLFLQQFDVPVDLKRKRN